uniref:Putative ovule protein n=1 Tax=Solanum chacoense TaxID=4108 RepID=A0A0V0GN89_SOLCH
MCGRSGASFLAYTDFDRLCKQTSDQVLCSWINQRMKKQQKKIWMTIGLCILWSISLERNRRCFDRKGEIVYLVKNRCI